MQAFHDRQPFDSASEPVEVKRDRTSHSKKRFLLVIKLLPNFDTGTEMDTMIGASINQWMTASPLTLWQNLYIQKERAVLIKPN